MQSSISKIAKYGSKFGENPGVEYVFPDFKLLHRSYRDLNETERKLKQQAMASGVDGGLAMLSPMNGFAVQTLDGKQVDEFEMSTLPWAKRVFVIKGMQFELKTHGMSAGQMTWIVRVLP